MKTTYFEPYSKIVKLLGSSIEIQYGNDKHTWFIKIINTREVDSGNNITFVKTINPAYFLEDILSNIDKIYVEISKLVSDKVDKMELGFSLFKICSQAMKRDSIERGAPRSFTIVKRAKYDFIVHHISDIERSKITDPVIIDILAIMENSIRTQSVSEDVYLQSLKLFDFLSAMKQREGAADKIRMILKKSKGKITK